MPPSPSTLTPIRSAMQSPTTICAVGAVVERGPGGSRGPDSEGDSEGDAGGNSDPAGNIEGLPRAAAGEAAPSACTAVGAELRELGRSRS